MIHDPDHPAFGLEPSRRREQAAADLRAANAWLAAEVAAMDAAERRARLDGALALLIVTLCAFFWTVIILLLVNVVR